MKIIKIECCAICPFEDSERWNDVIQYYCSKVRNKLEDHWALPSWCPLEDLPPLEQVLGESK